MTLSLRLPLVVVVLLAGSSAFALEQEHVDVDATDTDLSAVDNGWYHNVAVAAGLSFSTSNRVVGQEDGATTTISLNVNYDADLFRGQHEFQNTLSVTQALTRTPLVDQFVKSGDELFEEAIYYYHLRNAPWFGPFARASIRTALFKGFDVPADTTDYLVTRNNGTTAERLERDRLQLTRNFGPTTLKQSLGVFAEPSNDPALTIDVRLGFGARETFADGNFVIADDDATPEVDVTELSDFAQVGAEAALVMTGTTPSGDVTYGASFEMLVPFYDSTDDSDLNAWESTNYEAGANLAFIISNWVNVGYQFGALKEPQLLDEWQVTNQLLLTITQSYSSTPASRAERRAR